MADENRKFCREKVKFQKFSRKSKKNFENRGENLKQRGKMHHGLRGWTPLYAPALPIQDLLPCKKLSYWFGSTISQGLLYPSFFYTYIYIVVPPFGLRPVVTWLSLVHERLWLNLEVLLLWAHPTGISYLCLLETFFLYHLISSERDRERERVSSF